MTFDIRAIYWMIAAVYLMLHGIIWVSLSRYRREEVKLWSLGGMVSAAGVAFLGSEAWVPDWVVAVFGQVFMALGNYVRQFSLRSLGGAPPRSWVVGQGLLNLAYLGVNGTLFFMGASRPLMMTVFFAFYTFNCINYWLIGRELGKKLDSLAVRSVQWSGLILSLTLGIKCIGTWGSWGADDLYEYHWDQMQMLAGQFLGISLLNFGFMQILMDRFHQERMQTEEALREQSARAQQAEQSAQALSQVLRGREDVLRQLTLSNKSAGMGALVSSMAHEVNQPLATIVLKSELIDSYLTGDDVEPEVRSLLKQIREDTYRAGGMIRILRNMFNSGTSHFGKLDFPVLLRDVVGMVQSHAQRQGIVLAVDAPQSLLLTGDATQLQQVVLNLLNNAVQSFVGMNVAVPRIWVHCQLLGDLMELRVQDNGCGIDPAVRDDVFALFKSPRSRSMGVGLWLSQSVVQNHGGTLDFISTLGQGTVFVLRLSAKAYV